MLVQVGRRFVSEQRDIDPLFAKAMQDLLSNSKVFHDTHEEFIRDLIVSCNRKEYPPNRYLMEEGTRGDSMFVLFRGVVEVTVGGRYICKLRDGSIVGEAALLNIDNRRTASVRSVQKCDIAIISRASFHSILEKYPWEKRKFQREMKNKLMELGKLIDVKEDLNLEQQATQCDALKSIPFFAYDESLNDFVAELAMNSSVAWYRPGTCLIQEGDSKCDEMFVLLKGSCEVFSCGIFLGRLESEIIGEIGVLDLLEHRTATVVTATSCQCARFTRQVIIPILAKYPDARLRLLDHARKRLLSLNDIISANKASEVNPKAILDKEQSLASIGRRPGCAVGFGPTVDPVDSSLFASSPLFQEIPLALASALSKRMVTKEFEAGKLIFQEGDKFEKNQDYVYWILKGEAEVWKAGNFVMVAKEGQTFGELEAFKEWPTRQATVKSHTKVTLRCVVARSLLEVMKDYSDEETTEFWNEEINSRSEQLRKKSKLQEQLKMKTVDIDFMFMKLPGRQKDNKVTPKNESMLQALEGLEVLEWQATGKMPVKRLQALPPLTAR